MSKKKWRNAGRAGNNAQPAPGRKPEEKSTVIPLPSKPPAQSESDHKPEEKSVFITSLSELPAQPTAAYYYDPEKGKYLTGSFTNEPGAKLFLSTHKADKLVVIGSKQTYTDKRDISCVTLGQIDINSTPEKGEKALDYFKRSIASFVRSKDIIPKQKYPIPPERQQELMAIVVKTMTEANYPEPSVWFDVLANDNVLVTSLRAKLNDDVQNAYSKADEIRAFEESINLPPLPDLSRLEDEDTSVNDMVRELRDMQNKLFQTLIQKEQFLLLGVTTIESRILRLENEQMARRSEALAAATDELTARIDAQQAVINKLHNFVVALQKELADVRGNRVQEEYNWVRQKLFEELADDRKHKINGDQLSAELEFVPLMKGNVYNLQGIIQAIFSARSNDEHIRIYLDMQGGDRTEAFVRSQILSLVTNEPGSTVSIEKIISTAFSPRNFVSSMRDETANYKISDLVSGMNAFIEYGKTGTLIDYFEETNADQKALLGAMEEIDYAITMSDVNTLETGIENLRRSLSGQIADNTEVGELFAVLKGGIERDYGKLLKGERVDTLDLIEWTCRKDLIMQSLALIEARIPDYLYEKGILFYPQDEEQFLNDIQNDESKGKEEDKEKKRLPPHAYFLKRYFIRDVIKSKYKNMRQTVSGYDSTQFKAYLEEYQKVPGTYVTAELNAFREEKKGTWIRVAVFSKLNNSFYQRIGQLVNCYNVLVQARNNVFHIGNKIPTHEDVHKEIEILINLLRPMIDQLDKQETENSK